MRTITRATEVIITLLVAEGAEASALAATQKALDAGALQDAINGPGLRVRSAVAKGKLLQQDGFFTTFEGDGVGLDHVAMVGCAEEGEDDDPDGTIKTVVEGFMASEISWSEAFAALAGGLAEIGEPTTPAHVLLTMLGDLPDNIGCTYAGRLRALALDGRYLGTEAGRALADAADICAAQAALEAEDEPPVTLRATTT